MCKKERSFLWEILIYSETNKALEKKVIKFIEREKKKKKEDINGC